MPQTPTRIVGPAQLSNSAATVYTVPAATTTILRDVEVVNTTGGAVTFTLSIGSDAAGTRLFSAASVPADGVPRQWTGNVPLAAGETVQAYASAGASLTLTVGALVVT